MFCKRITTADSMAFLSLCLFRRVQLMISTSPQSINFKVVFENDKPLNDISKDSFDPWKWNPSGQVTWASVDGKLVIVTLFVTQIPGWWARVVNCSQLYGCFAVPLPSRITIPSQDTRVTAFVIVRQGFLMEPQRLLSFPRKETWTFLWSSRHPVRIGKTVKCSIKMHVPLARMAKQSVIGQGRPFQGLFSFPSPLC